jgi:hypothetical protein
MSPESSSLMSHFSVNDLGVISKWAEMRLISFLVKVGVIVLQQLAHSMQFTSFHTVASTLATSFGISTGTILSNLFRNAVSDFLLRPDDALNFFKSIKFVNIGRFLWNRKRILRLWPYFRGCLYMRYLSGVGVLPGRSNNPDETKLMLQFHPV